MAAVLASTPAARVCITTSMRRYMRQAAAAGAARPQSQGHMVHQEGYGLAVVDAANDLGERRADVDDLELRVRDGIAELRDAAAHAEGASPRELPGARRALWRCFSPSCLLVTTTLPVDCQ